MERLTSDDLKPETRVKTPRGLGKVVYVRMKSPSFAEVATVSVKLDVVMCGYCGDPFPCSDSKRLDIRGFDRAKHYAKGSSGTMFFVEEVELSK